MRHRALFYSHDSFGLGHFRRSLNIASHLTRHVDDLSVLMLTGIESPASFEKPRGVDFVKLPAIWKADAEEYRSRHLRVSFQRVRRIREQLIRTVTRAYAPSLVVVDNVPRGVGGEMLATLRYLRQRHPKTRIVLTLRDVLDEPSRIAAQWKKDDVYGALDRFYDEIWIAGCREVFDPIELYGFPPRIAERTRFCGYVVRSVSEEETTSLALEYRFPERPMVVVCCGGGGDGAPLIRAYAAMVQKLPPEALYSVVFLGPDMPPAERRELKNILLPLHDRVLLFDYRPDLTAFLRLAAVTVSMAGYNTMCEVVSLGKRAVVVPRGHPRVEQVLRARSFEKLGLVHVVDAADLSADTLSRAVFDALSELRSPASEQPKLPTGMDFGGRRRIAKRVERFLGLGTRRQ